MLNHLINHTLVWHRCHRSWVAGSKVQWSDAKVNNKHLSALLKGILKDFSSLCDQIITSSLHVNVAKKKERKRAVLMLLWMTVSKEDKRSPSGHSIPRSLFGCAIVWLASVVASLMCQGRSNKNRRENKSYFPQIATHVCCRGTFLLLETLATTLEKVSATHSPSGNTITSKLPSSPYLHFNSSNSLNQVKCTQSSIWEKDD